MSAPASLAAARAAAIEALRAYARERAPAVLKELGDGLRAVERRFQLRLSGVDEAGRPGECEWALSGHLDLEAADEVRDFKLVGRAHPTQAQADASLQRRVAATTLAVALFDCAGSWPYAPPAWWCAAGQCAAWAQCAGGGLAGGSAPVAVPEADTENYFCQRDVTRSARPAIPSMHRPAFDWNRQLDVLAQHSLLCAEALSGQR